MNKTMLILQREYLTRVKKKSFIIMTFLGPLLMASLMIVPVVLASLSDISKKNIAVLDETNWFSEKFESGDNMIFIPVFDSFAIEKQNILEGKYDALLYIPQPELNVPNNAELFSLKQSSLTLRTYVRNVMKTEVENRKLVASGIDPRVIKESKTSINILTIRLDEDGSESKSFTEVQVILGLLTSILIYFFIFLFGSQVMRGVIEEKTSRIIEVIVSSVRPFQLMMGKITGIALVGLTQFFLWIILTLGIYGLFVALFGSEVMNAQQAAASGSFLNQTISEEQTLTSQSIAQVFEVIHSIDFGVIIFGFLFYFIAGYLLYAALFAAIGSAVDNEADTQQFMLPVSLPLILGIVVSNFVVNNPDGSIAFWLSMFPLTSPVLMMVRLPFGVPYWELALSMTLLVIGFLFTTWLAAKIYRTGILMYGKKVNYKEVWKWLRY
ncbi:MAG: ABC transporter permease [Bacteroidetes bacterium HGW-Bacteroidetes-1]|jgi:ABC-2 type transport system permease protein|nr:MAG: ABC transporter permease [Bacteroidetes bacterium HGW-Bacteroidetes-1]